MMLNQQGVPLKENLEEVTRRMAARYPHIVNPETAYQPPRLSDPGNGDDADGEAPPPRSERQRPSSVEGQSSGRSVSRNAATKGWRDIPAAEREIMTATFINQGLYGDPDKEGLAKVQARAAAAYWSQYPEG